MSQVESFWHWKTPAGQFEYCHSPTHSVPQASHTLSGICAARAIMWHGGITMTSTIEEIEKKLGGEYTCHIEKVR